MYLIISHRNRKIVCNLQGFMYEICIAVFFLLIIDIISSIEKCQKFKIYWFPETFHQSAWSIICHIIWFETKTSKQEFLSDAHPLCSSIRILLLSQERGFFKLVDLRVSCTHWRISSYFQNYWTLSHNPTGMKEHRESNCWISL